MTKVKFIRKLHGLEIWHVYKDGIFERTLFLCDENTTPEQLKYHQETLKRIKECLQ